MNEVAGYHERLSVPLRWWAQGTMLVASLWLAVAVALPTGGIWAVTGVAFLAMAALLLSYGWATVTVSRGVLRAGRAQITTALLAGATPLDAEETRRQWGPEADARAYLLLRPYIKESVRVDLADPRDPTPYWLLSTRRPDELAAALESARAAQLSSD